MLQIARELMRHWGKHPRGGPTKNPEANRAGPCHPCHAPQVLGKADARKLPDFHHQRWIQRGELPQPTAQRTAAEPAEMDRWILWNSLGDSVIVCQWGIRTVYGRYTTI